MVFCSSGLGAGVWELCTHFQCQPPGLQIATAVKSHTVFPDILYWIPILSFILWLETLRIIPPPSPPPLEEEGTRDVPAVSRLASHFHHSRDTAKLYIFSLIVLVTSLAAFTYITTSLLAIPVLRSVFVFPYHLPSDLLIVQTLGFVSLRKSPFCSL